jgi:hypothetical protein
MEGMSVPETESTAIRVSCRCGYRLKAFRTGATGHHVAGFIALRDRGATKAGARVVFCPACNQQLAGIAWSELLERLPAAFGP